MEGLLTGDLMDVARSGGGADDGDSHRRDGGEEVGDGGKREERSRSSSVEVVASVENDADRDRQADGDRRRQGYSPPQSHRYQYPQQQGHKQGPGTWGWPGGLFSEWNSCCRHMPPGKLDSETQFPTVQFDWNCVLKAILIGVSPEFEVALFTLCFFLGGEDNHVCLGP